MGTSSKGIPYNLWGIFAKVSLRDEIFRAEFSCYSAKFCSVSIGDIDAIPRLPLDKAILVIAKIVSARVDIKKTEIVVLPSPRQSSNGDLWFVHEVDTLGGRS
jgi:hypothetical protein